MMFAWCCAVQR